MVREWQPGQVVLFAALLACGSAGEASEASEATGGVGTGGTSSTGGGSSGGPGSGGTSGAAAAGTSGGGAGGSAGALADCSGAFGTPELVFDSGTSPAGSLTLTADELELYYGLQDTSTDAFPVFVRKRSSRVEPFGNPTEVPELTSICAPAQPSMDVSNDGMRMYMECDYGVGPLHIATRASRSEPFQRTGSPLGDVGDSIDVSADELVLIGVKDVTSDGRVGMHQRASLDAPFGAETPVPGIDGEFRHPTLAPDGLTLFGTLNPDPADPAASRLAVAERTTSSAAFSVPIELVVPGASQQNSDYTPALSADCRSLYFLRAAGDAASRTWSVYVARR